MQKYTPATLPTTEVIQLMIQICETLAYVHEQGIIVV